MKLYKIELQRTVSHLETVEVLIEADSVEEAQRKVRELPAECNEDCPEDVIIHKDNDYGDWVVESVNSDDTDQEECLNILLNRKAA